MVTEVKPVETEISDGGNLAAYAFEASTLLKVLGHQGRLMVLSHLKDGPRTVGELQELMGATQPVISSHLARLRFEGLVTFEKFGKTSIYALADDKARQILDLIGAVFCDGLRDHVAKPKR
jgi:ArsR family transcriptional regulator